MYDTMFMHQMLHHLRNPLTFLYSSLQILEKDMPEVKSYRYWTEATNDIHYILDILNQVTFYINSSSENFKKCYIPDMIEACLDDTDIPIPVFYENLSKEAIIYGNQKYIQLALDSLLKNAYEANSSSIHISLKEDGDYYLISVKDTGNGMSKDTLTHIFEPFYSEKEQHTGLGLPLSRSVFLTHQGKITCSSSKGEGTTFKIYLPAIHNAKENTI